MGNLVSPSVSAAGKIVLPDGSVRVISEPVSVAELMMEHPCHLVVDARHVASGGGAKVAALPADHALDAGGVYVVLPATRGRVSADEARRVLTLTTSRPRSVPADGRREQQVETVEAAAWLHGLGDHRPEFLSRELTCRGWKPSLKTIQERALPRKVPHWLF